MREVTRRRARLGVVPLAALCVIALVNARCGGETTRNDGRNSGGASSGGAPNVGGANTMGGMTQVATGGLPNGFGCPGIPIERPPQTDATCTAQTECDCIGRDTYFLIERSERMGEPWGATTRWEYLKEALRGFRTSTKVGVAFSGGLSDDEACASGTYLQVPVVVGPNATDSQGLVSALELAPPAGKNPLLLALAGLGGYLAFDAGDSGRVSMIVLVTATLPDICAISSTVDDLALAIANLRSSYDFRGPIVTIALDADYDVDVVAKVAGTLPFRIGANEPPSRWLEVFDACFFPGLECPALELPSPPADLSIDLESLWLGFNTSRGVETPPRLSGPEDCANSPNGGYYVDTMVRLCPCTCPLLRYCNFAMQFRCSAL